NELHPAGLTKFHFMDEHRYRHQPTRRRYANHSTKNLPQTLLPPSGSNALKVEGGLLDLPSAPVTILPESVASLNPMSLKVAPLFMACAFALTGSSAQVLDQSNIFGVAGGYAGWAVDADRTVAQTFTVGTSGFLTEVDLQVVRWSQTPTQDLVLK